MLAAQQEKANALGAEMTALNQALGVQQEKNSTLAAEILGLNDTIANLTLQHATDQEKYAELDTLHSKKDAQWRIERNEMEGQLSSAIKAKKSAVDDVELFRSKYYEASAFVGTVRQENAEMEKKVAIAESQTKDGVATMRALFEVRIAALQTAVSKWKKQTEDLLERDRRMEEVRERAAMWPEVKTENEQLKKELMDAETEIDQLTDAVDQFEYDRKVWEKERKLWYNELRRKQEKEEHERMDEDEDEVYPCQWTGEGGKLCEEVFEDKEVRHRLVALPARVDSRLCIQGLTKHAIDEHTSKIIS